MKTIKKIIDDTLKEANGKWSKKSLTMFTSFAIAIIMGFYIVIKYHQYSVEVFYGFLAVALGSSILDLKDKLNKRNSEIEKPKQYDNESDN